LLAQSNVTKEEYAVYADFFESVYKENFKHSEADLLSTKLFD